MSTSKDESLIEKKKKFVGLVTNQPNEEDISYKESIQK